MQVSAPGTKAPRRSGAGLAPHSANRERRRGTRQDASQPGGARQRVAKSGAVLTSATLRKSRLEKSRADERPDPRGAKCLQHQYGLNVRAAAVQKATKRCDELQVSRGKQTRSAVSITQNGLLLRRQGISLSILRATSSPKVSSSSSCTSTSIDISINPSIVLSALITGRRVW